MTVLVKIGSALISRGNRINYEWLQRKVDELAMLYREGHRILIVSSGAVAAGMELMGQRKRPADTLHQQMLAGMGQVRLSRYYKDLFKEKYIMTAQMLLTHHNFDTPDEVTTIVEILRAYLDEGVVPIVNENDMINKEELESEGAFTDNDILAAFVARTVGVDKALILTNVDGLYRSDPNGEHGDTDFIPRVDVIDDAIHSMAQLGKSDLGLGGMRSKIIAAEMMKEKGISTIIGNGAYPIPDLLEGKVRATTVTA